MLRVKGLCMYAIYLLYCYQCCCRYSMLHRTLSSKECSTLLNYSHENNVIRYTPRYIAFMLVNS